MSQTRFVLRRKPHVQDKRFVRFCLEGDRSFDAKFLHGWWVGETTDKDVALAAESRGWIIVAEHTTEPAPVADPVPTDAIDSFLENTVKEIDEAIDGGQWDDRLVDLRVAEEAAKNRKGVLRSIGVRTRRLQAEE